jgi:hypothetical protein
MDPMWSSSSKLSAGRRRPEGKARLRCWAFLPGAVSAGVARFPGELYGEAVETVHRPDAGERGAHRERRPRGCDHVSERFEKASGEELLLSGEAAYQSLVHEGLPPLPVDILLGRTAQKATSARTGDRTRRGSARPVQAVICMWWPQEWM